MRGRVPVTSACLVAALKKLELTTAELERQQALTDDLITQMLPRKVADDLMHGRPIEPEAFSSVTIFFSDIVGFTTISQSVQPKDVINLLNQVIHSIAASDPCVAIGCSSGEFADVYHHGLLCL